MENGNLVAYGIYAFRYVVLAPAVYKMIPSQESVALIGT